MMRPVPPGRGAVRKRGGLLLLFSALLLLLFALSGSQQPGRSRDYYLGSVDTSGTASTGWWSSFLNGMKKMKDGLLKSADVAEEHASDVDTALNKYGKMVDQH